MMALVMLSEGKPWVKPEASPYHFFGVQIRHRHQVRKRATRL